MHVAHVSKRIVSYIAFFLQISDAVLDACLEQDPFAKVWEKEMLALFSSRSLAVRVAFILL